MQRSCYFKLHRLKQNELSKTVSFCLSIHKYPFVLPLQLIWMSVGLQDTFIASKLSCLIVSFLEQFGHEHFLILMIILTSKQRKKEMYLWGFQQLLILPTQVSLYLDIWDLKFFRSGNTCFPFLRLSAYIDFYSNRLIPWDTLFMHFCYR